MQFRSQLVGCGAYLPERILTNEELARIKEMNHRGWKTKVIDIAFERAGGEKAMLKALDRICAQTTQVAPNASPASATIFLDGAWPREFR